jgi:hypothetical protein
VGIAFVTMHPRFLERVVSEYRKLLHVISVEAAEMGCVRAQIKSKLLPKGRSSDVYLSIEDGELSFTQQPAHEEPLLLGHA